MPLLNYTSDLHGYLLKLIQFHLGADAFDPRGFANPKLKFEKVQNLERVTKQPKKFNITKITSKYAVEMNRFELLEMAEKMPEVLQQEIQSTITETTVEHIQETTTMQKWLSDETIRIAKEKQSKQYKIKGSKEIEYRFFKQQQGKTAKFTGTRIASS